ncbi:MAG: hypothetical protein JST19_14075 [Bacteroidetes bacterium]|nr:hypothetical protein [Bacteroidota bacterium]
MASRRRRKRTVKRIFKKIKAIWIVKGILYILGIMSFFYSQRQFEVTIISLSTVLTIGIVGGILVSLILERTIKYYLFSVIFFGSLCTAAFFWVNKELSSNNEVKLKQRILYKALASATIEHSKVTISFDSFTKDIPISSDQEFSIAPASFIILTVHPGGLGHYIIISSELKK